MQFMKNKKLLGIAAVIALAASLFLVPVALAQPPYFDDVPPGHMFYDQINWIYENGITSGCSVTPPLYCPDAAVSRGQMAVFMYRLAGNGSGGAIVDADTLDGLDSTDFASDTHDHFGETWSGTGSGLTINSSNDGAAVLEASNTSTTSTSTAVHGVSGTGTSLVFVNNAGVFGESDSSGIGVVGLSDSYAVYGGSTISYGVYGSSNSSYGVYANGPAGDLRLHDTGTIYANTSTSSDMELHSNDRIDLHLDDDDNSTSQFRILDGGNSVVFSIDENGDMTGGAHDHLGETWTTTGDNLQLTGPVNNGILLDVENSGPGTSGIGLRGKAGTGSPFIPPSPTGVYGTSDSGIGVLAHSDSGDALYAHAEGSGYAVNAFSDSGSGIYAAGPTADVMLSGIGTIKAVDESVSSMSLTSNNLIDLFLDADNNSTSTFSVHNGLGSIVFEVDENGKIDFTDWEERTSYISLSAADFRPNQDGYDFTNSGEELTNNNSVSDLYIAPVQLPHGATVTEMTFYWNDTSGMNGSAVLERQNLSGTSHTMASAVTAGSSGNGNSSDSAISYADVDASAYAYFVHLFLPDSDVSCYGVVIEYTFTEPY